ncbi:MAG: hypothetical protein QME79_12300 [Bacillota bacterium]|nr:hypothetical protein [Bacillota bacterium]
MARLFTNQIADYLVNLIQTNIAGLRTVAKGSLDMLPAPTSLSSAAPGVIVEPGRVRISPVRIGSSFEIVYPFRLWYFRQYSPGEEVAEKLVQEAEAVVELLFDNFQLPGFSQPNCLAVHGYPTIIDYAATEDEVLQKVLELPVSIVPIDYEVHTEARR